MSATRGRSRCVASSADPSFQTRAPPTSPTAASPSIRRPVRGLRLLGARRSRTPRRRAYLDRWSLPGGHLDATVPIGTGPLVALRLTDDGRSWSPSSAHAVSVLTRSSLQRLRTVRIPRRRRRARGRRHQPRRPRVARRTRRTGVVRGHRRPAPRARAALTMPRWPGRSSAPPAHGDDRRQRQHGDRVGCPPTARPGAQRAHRQVQSAAASLDGPRCTPRRWTATCWPWIYRTRSSAAGARWGGLRLLHAPGRPRFPVGHLARRLRVRGSARRLDGRAVLHPHAAAARTFRVSAADGSPRWRGHRPRRCSRWPATPASCQLMERVRTPRPARPCSACTPCSAAPRPSRRSRSRPTAASWRPAIATRPPTPDLPALPAAFLATWRTDTGTLVGPPRELEVGAGTGRSDQLCVLARRQPAGGGLPDGRVLVLDTASGTTTRRSTRPAARPRWRSPNGTLAPARRRGRWTCGTRRPGRRRPPR